MRIDTSPAGYPAFCERLWNSWLDDPKAFADSIAAPLEAEYAPEPYLRFSLRNSANRRPLRFLFTNPGAGRHEQRRAALRAGRHGIHDRMTYDEAAFAFGKFYCANLAGSALRRIEAMLRLAKDCGADSVIQYETIPFHGKSLPGKRKFAAWLKEAPLLADYADSLRVMLRKHTVLALSAAPPNAPLSATTIAESPWLSWQAKLMGIRSIAMMRIVPLVTKQAAPTCAFIRSDDPHGSGFVLMKGSNNFPGPTGLKILAQAIAGNSL